MYSFLLLIFSFKALKGIEECDKKKIVASIIFAVLVIIIPKLTSDYGEINSIIISSSVFALAYIIVIVLIKTKKADRAMCFLLIFCSLVTETVFCNTGSYVVMSAIGVNERIEQLSEIKLTGSEEKFYRVECTGDEKTIGDMCYMKPALYGYNGVTVFSSMADKKISNLNYREGIRGNTINSLFYMQQTPIYDMMNNIEYLYTNVKTDNSNEYWGLLKEYGETIVLKNKYSLPLAFCVDKSIENWNTESSNPFEIQNNWFMQATGEKNVLKQIKINEKTEINIASENEGKYRLNRSEINEDITFTAKIENVKNCFIYIRTKSYKICKINQQSYRCDDPYVYSLNKEDKSGDITIKFPYFQMTNESDKVEIEIYCCYVDNEILSRGYEKLKKSPLNLTSFSETNIKGDISAAEDSVVWTSIPYNRGWKVIIDGKEIEKDDYIAIQDAYLCFNIEKGDHNIELRYIQPGLKEGTIISISTLFLLMAYQVIKKKKTKK